MILTVKEILDACRQLSPDLRRTIYITLMEEEADAEYVREAEYWSEIESIILNLPSDNDVHCNPELVKWIQEQTSRGGSK